MITPINIALLGVVLAAVALVILRRRRSGATHEAVSQEMPDETTTTVDEPAAPIHDDVFSKHVWSEAAATLTPVREDEPVAAADDPDEDQRDDEAEDELAFPPEDEAPDALQEADDEGADDAVDLDVPEGEHDQDTGEIAGLELEDMTDPDDGLGDIITEPGWYLPGETDMTRGSPGAQSGSLIPQGDLAMAGGPRDDGADLAGETPSALLAEDDIDFSATTPWAAPAGTGTEPAESSWLGLADDEAAAAAVEPEVSFEIAPSPSDDIFELFPLDEGIPGNGLEPGAPPPALDRWQDPVTPVAPLGIASAAAGMTVAQHGPLTVSIDPVALVAMEVEEIKRSTSQGDGAVSWELTLKVELRRDNGSDTAD